MNSIDFVQAIKIVTCQGASKGVLDALNKPAGRRPDPMLVELSEWYHKLTSDERQYLVRVINMSAQQATYNFLCVLDGLAAIAPQGTKPTLELFCVEEGSRQLLNDPHEEELTTLFKNC